MDEDGWDPEMQASHQAYTDMAAALPPMLLQSPLDGARATNDTLALALAGEGPAMHTEDRWVAARGRRVLCRLYRPGTGTLPGILPALVYFHGGGWVWSSVDTHDRLAREYAAATGCAVISVDYALSPRPASPRRSRSAPASPPHRPERRRWGIDRPASRWAGTAPAATWRSAPPSTSATPQAPPSAPSWPCIPCATPTSRRPATGGSARRTLPDRGEDALLLERLRGPTPRPGSTRSPPRLRADLRGLPPTMVQLARLDVLHDEGRALAAKLEQAGVPTTLDVVPGVIHGFLRASVRVTKARTAITAASTWLQARFQ